jgi:phospholipid/cholesterol/gamma-HCH transport system ATP-binding protein
MIDRPQTPADVPAIEMRAVSVGAMRDQNLMVLRDVNWTVAPGEFWVIAGLQGSGKTDFLMMTGGLMAPVSGEYRLFGEPMPIFDDVRLPLRLRLGLVFYTGQLFNHLTIRENIALPLRYHYNLTKAAAAEQVQPWLAALDLEPWADSTPGALGGNWQKRVGLARALTLEPEVLLVDTPLTALDLRHASWWLNFLEQLSKGHPLLHGRPITVVLTASDLRPWRRRACCFAVIRDGSFGLFKTWDKLEAASTDLISELLMAEPHPG